jgi:hypothetical protein
MTSILKSSTDLTWTWLFDVALLSNSARPFKSFFFANAPSLCFGGF